MSEDCPVPRFFLSRLGVRFPRRPIATEAVTALALTGFLALGFGFAPGNAAAATVDPVQQHNSNALWFENWIGLGNATLVVSGPDGKVSQVFAKEGTPVFELGRGEVLDGIYRYELKAATEETVKIVNPIDNGRGDPATSRQAPFYMNGSFTVSRGVIITPNEIREE